MIFQHTLDKVLSGEKTQTSRQWKDTWEIFPNGIADDWAMSMVFETTSRGKYRLKYHVGQTLAIQPARGKKSIGRIEITSLTKRDIRYFLSDDFEREGFWSSREFYLTWFEMHNKAGYLDCLKAYDDIDLQNRFEVAILPCNMALVINFKLVEVY